MLFRLLCQGRDDPVQSGGLLSLTEKSRSPRLLISPTVKRIELSVELSSDEQSFDAHCQEPRGSGSGGSTSVGRSLYAAGADCDVGPGGCSASRSRRSAAANRCCTCVSANPARRSTPSHASGLRAFARASCGSFENGLRLGGSLRGGFGFAARSLRGGPAGRRRHRRHGCFAECCCRR